MILVDRIADWLRFAYSADRSWQAFRSCPMSLHSPLDNSRITPPLRVAQRCPKITKRECDGMATTVNTKRRLVLLRYWLPPRQDTAVVSVS